MEFNDSQFSVEKGMSQEDKRVFIIMEEFVEFRDGYYEIVFLWKVFFLDLSNNKIVVEYRFGLLKKRLIKDLGLYLKYILFMEDLFERGYAQKVFDDQRDGSFVWYLFYYFVIYL